MSGDYIYARDKERKEVYFLSLNFKVEVLCPQAG